jgi:hypothetical protein
MAKYSGSIPVTGFIAPTDSQDTYPVVDPLYGIDGLRNVSTEAEMYAIPSDRRRQGMVVGCTTSGFYYKLKSPPWNGGASDWTDFITSPLVGNVTRTQYVITNGTVSIPANYQYVVWGGLTIGASGSLDNQGQVIIINGTLSFAGSGTYSGTGELTYVTDFSRQTNLVGPNPNWNTTPPSVKYSASFSSTASVTLTITHNLGTTDIVYSVRENNNFITANVEINDSNSIKLTTNANVTNGRINIIG